MEVLGFWMRLQALEGYVEKIRAMTYCEDYEGLLAVRHKGTHTKENPHYHIVIKCKLELQTFRKRMKKIFSDGKGNAHMSITNWDGNDKVYSYCFHEDPDQELVARKGITDEFLDRMRAQNLLIQEEVKKAKDKAAWTLEDDAYNHYVVNKQENGRFPHETEIGKFMILKALRNGKYIPQRWLLVAMIQRVQYRLRAGDEDAEETYAYNLAKSLLGYN